ncbi:Twin-arginine translocation pathway signal [Enterovibrio sp. ZSDZ35]|uniref:Twin-arginine translocation pathway signal n=1 Tax=Enterovibrio qingdaonensis TaxID=2899818 RepID=A0ABT5QUJ7_9GAMM|nr:Twin-arginine translocation pathway signal [Enterovibrio sp. ZSDZ35]MDD1783961.1 Twin-arginine translocation pathway signal [Enterovibrio sp. ZSDZ35]
MSYIKIPHPLAEHILKLYDPQEGILPLVEPGMTPQQLIQRAVQEGLYADAVIFLAHGLPVREAVWWGCVCADTRNDWNEAEGNAIRAAKAWVHTPDETSRRYAEQTANEATLQNGAGWIAQAVFWSGGSMTGPSDPVVPPPEYLYAQAVGGSINLTAILPDGAHAETRYHQFIEMGINIANGGNGNLGSAA